MTLKVCQLCAVDFTLKHFLIALIDGMRSQGWQVTAVCSDGPFVPVLRAAGYAIQTLPIARSLNPFKSAAALYRLWRLFRRERFDVLHVHTPVAALLGRIAARLAGIPMIVYTAHGFYFHEGMPPLRRAAFTWLEWCGAKLTHLLFTQSEEDARTAIEKRFLPVGRVLAIGNGVDIAHFDPARIARATAGCESGNWAGAKGTSTLGPSTLPASSSTALTNDAGTAAGTHPRARLRTQWGVPTDVVLIGIIGRMVAEKGYPEFFEAAKSVAAQRSSTYFVAVGERLTSDHAGSIDASLADARAALGARLILTGLRTDIAEVLDAIDIFTLPSHREGMPRTIIEAMLMAKPVVATNIRGSREEVVDGQTGLLTPVRDASALARALVQLSGDAGLRHKMGAAGRVRALQLYDESVVVARQIDALRAHLPAALRARAAGV